MEQSFTACMPSLTATSASGLGISFPQFIITLTAMSPRPHPPSPFTITLWSW